MNINDLIKMKEAFGKRFSIIAKVSSTALIVLSIINVANIVHIPSFLFNILFGLSSSFLIIHFSPEIKKYLDNIDFTKLRIKFFNNAHKIDKAILLIIACPIMLITVFFTTQIIYSETSKVFNNYQAFLFSSIIPLFFFLFFYFVLVKRKRVSIFLPQGIIEGIFKPAMIKEHDIVSVISDDERGQYSGSVISTNSPLIKQLKFKDVFKKRFHLPFNRIETRAIDIGFGMYIEAPLDRVTISYHEINI